MAYKLEFPPSSRVHLVLHVSFLKKVIHENTLVQTILKHINEQGKIILELKKILELGIKKLRNQSITDYLIKWKNLLVEDTT